GDRRHRLRPRSLHGQRPYRQRTAEPRPDPRGHPFLRAPGGAVRPLTMLLIRDVTRGDLKGLHRLAQGLDTVNLPADEKALEEQIDHSIRSFSGKVKDPMEREYLFVLEGPRGALVGTSMIIARHGSRDTPHVSFEVSERENYSSTIDRHFRHKV